MSLNPVEALALNFFLSFFLFFSVGRGVGRGLNLQLLKMNFHCGGHIFISIRISAF